MVQGAYPRPAAVSTLGVAPVFIEGDGQQATRTRYSRHSEADAGELSTTHAAAGTSSPAGR